MSWVLEPVFWTWTLAVLVSPGSTPSNVKSRLSAPDPPDVVTATVPLVPPICPALLSVKYAPVPMTAAPPSAAITKSDAKILRTIDTPPWHRGLHEPAATAVRTDARSADRGPADLRIHGRLRLLGDRDARPARDELAGPSPDEHPVHLLHA